MGERQVWEVTVRRIDTQKVSFAPVTIRVSANSAEEAHAIVESADDPSEGGFHWKSEGGFHWKEADSETEDTAFEVDQNVTLSEDQDSDPDIV